MDNQVYNQQPEGKGKSIASMVLGICSIVCTCGGPVSIVLGILAINFSNKAYALNADGQTFAKVGKITGIIGLILGIIAIIYYIVCIVATAAMGSLSYLNF